MQKPCTELRQAIPRSEAKCHLRPNDFRSGFSSCPSVERFDVSAYVALGSGARSGADLSSPSQYISIDTIAPILAGEQRAMGAEANGTGPNKNDPLGINCRSRRRRF